MDEGWSAARDTIRTLFSAPPPDVRAVFDQLDEECGAADRGSERIRGDVYSNPPPLPALRFE